MTILQELFPTVSEFRKYAPYAESNITFDQLNSSAISAKKQISNCLILKRTSLLGKKPGIRSSLMDLRFKVPKTSICYTP